MVWADPIASAGDDWQDLARVVDLLAALNERREAVGLSAYAAPSAGDDAQVTTLWAGIQAAVIATCIRFQDPDTMDVTPGAIPANFTDALDWAGDQYTKATLMAAAGIGAGDWTRKRPREITSTIDGGTNGWRAFNTGDAMRLYDRVDGAWVLSSDQLSDPDLLTPTAGAAQAGDYIGDWILNEMQGALQAVSVVVYGPQGSVGIDTIASEADAEQGADSDGFKATSALATATADADWDTGNPAISLLRLGKFSVIDHQVGLGYRAAANTIRRTYTSTLQTGTYNYTLSAELVSKPEAVGFFGLTFEDFGQGLVEDDQNLFDSGSFDDGDTLTLGGTTAQPTWENDADGVEGWGWQISGGGSASIVHIVGVFTWEHP